MTTRAIPAASSWRCVAHAQSSPPSSARRILTHGRTLNAELSACWQCESPAINCALAARSPGSLWPPVVCDDHHRMPPHIATLVEQLKTEEYGEPAAP